MFSAGGCEAGDEGAHHAHVESCQCAEGGVSPVTGSPPR